MSDLMSAITELEAFADQLDAKGTAPTLAETARLKGLLKSVEDAKAAMRTERKEASDFLHLLGGDGASELTTTGIGSKAAWAADVANRVTKTVGEFGVKAITTGGIDIPQAVESVVTKPVEPARVIDLLVNRKPLSGNEFEFLRQTVRTNNAATVADNALKPTSVYTFEDEFDRARVFAHLTEPIPLRYLADHSEVESILRSQLAEDLLLALEENVLVGDGTGENFTGLTATAGIQTQAWSTDLLTTMRKARTAMVTSGETPNAWVFNHADLESIDLMREGGATGGFLDGIDDKVFGNLPKIGSSVIPAGYAYLGDWSQARLYVREGGRLDADVSGDLFDKNQVKLRYEGRFGFAVLRPSAFIKVDLTAA